MAMAAAMLMLLVLLSVLSTAAGFLVPAPALARRSRERTTVTAWMAPAPQMLLDGWARSNPFGSTASKAPARRPDGLDTEVVICGTGIAGLALAADLERRGVDYLVVEKARCVDT